VTPTDAFCAAAACGILLDQPCAGLSRCGRCRVRVVEGAAAVTDADREVLDPAEIRDGWRLACSLTVSDSATVVVQGTASTVASKGFGTVVRPDPSRVPLAFARQGSGRRTPGLALDIGTTSLAAALVDLASEEEVATASALNPQAEFGADVMSRIHAAGSDEGRRRLVSAVRRGIAGLTSRLLREAGLAGGEVVAASVVGNPAMLHLWCDVDPGGLGVAPYEGRWTAAVHARARDMELPIDPAAPVYAFPSVRSHVGADAVAAAVAVGLDRVAAPALLIDLGTNSEIVLSDGGRIFAASTAAGPAFECGGISCGMRAAEGAVDALRLQPDGLWSVHVIGDRAARGVCGSGLLDAVAELVRAGAIDPSGYLRDASQARGLVPDSLLGRLGLPGAPRRAVILPAQLDAGDISLTAADVRQLQLAVGAVRAGIEVLCAAAGVEASRLQTVFVAGTFGQYVRKASILRLGLLPAVPPDRVLTVGNAAGAGAVLALLDQRVRSRAERLVADANYVELAGRMDYQEALARSLRFPDPAEAP
jgi:uncharacterized 2Fe-2S/4Fe-4S cluster protein (DUF4445 family)